VNRKAPASGKLFMPLRFRALHEQLWKRRPMDVDNWISLAGVVVSLIAVCWAVSESRKADWQTRESAASARESAAAAKKAVELQELEWIWNRSAVLVVQDLRYEPYAVTTRFTLSNLGGVDAMRLEQHYRSGGNDWDTIHGHEAQAGLGSGESLESYFRFANPQFEDYQHLFLRIRYIDKKIRVMYIYAQWPEVSEGSSFHWDVVAMSLDGKPHPSSDGLPVEPSWSLPNITEEDTSLPTEP
jgi:hypothetical protein